MDNQNDLQSLSVKLYHYLSDVVVGSEKVVKFRRYFYKCFDDGLHEGDVIAVSSGSKAEGLDLPGSDIDLMVISCAYMVDEKRGNTKENRLILDTDNALPGFALVKVSDNSDFQDEVDVTQTVYGQLLKNDIFKQTSFQVWLANSSFSNIVTEAMKFDVQTMYKIQGPAVSTALKGIKDIDYVRCLPCRKWPSIAKRWLHRNRCCQWPSSDLITEAIHEGVLLVPVGSKSPTSEENNYEWRFSFSLTEKMLVHSFNHCQLLCYALLKIFLKEIIDKVNIFNKLLCSYYMKTILFWVLEEVDHSHWTPENLLRCFSLCLQRLHYFILCNYVPNYFIPEHNMIDGRFSEKIRKQLEIFIEKVLKGNLWKVVLSLELLSDLRHFKCSNSKHLHVISEFDKTILTMNIPDNTQIMVDRSFRSLSFFVYRILNENCQTFFKNMYAMAFMDLCRGKATSIKMLSVDLQHRSNKQYYSQYKQCLFNLLLNLNNDAVSGWLLLASFFYSCQEYRKMNSLLPLAEEISSRDLYALSYWSDLSAYKQIAFEKMIVPSRQFLKRLRHSLIRCFIVSKNVQTGDSFVFHKDLCTNYTLFSTGTPVVFIRFLSFLYFHKQNNTEGMNRALVLLQEAVEKSPKLDGISISTNFTFLLRAQIITGVDVNETIKSMFFVLKPFDVSGLV